MAFPLARALTALHGITSNHDPLYPCAPTRAAPVEGAPRVDAEVTLTQALGKSPDLHANDGCVPIRSQLWGTLLWDGVGDHLDVLGHYRDETPEVHLELRHHDWLTSGSRFNDASFEALMDAIVTGMLRSTNGR